MRAAPLLFALTALCAVRADAQLAPPNEAGVTLGHVHLAVTDVEAHTRFFTTMLGGTAINNGPLSLIQFPGVFVMLRKAEPSGPPAGSVVNHFGFVFKDLPAALALWKANNVKIEQATNPNQGYVHAPDGVRVEFFGDAALSVPVKMDHVHAYGTDIPAMQAWYNKAFGGVPGQRPRVSTPGWIDCVFFPGMNYSFSLSDVALAPTRGRSLDHVGFEVTDLDGFVKSLEAKGVKLDSPPRQVPGARTRVAFLTDPWGTYIEITENLAPDPK
jgi:catechol 2,3-dioxygenase-like lactoylglutathione lyase family enzyme